MSPEAALTIYTCVAGVFAGQLLTEMVSDFFFFLLTN